MWTDTRPSVEMPQLFELSGDVISFAGGLPDLKQLPLQEISAQLARVVRLGGRTALQYTTPHVSAGLVPGIEDLMGRTGIRTVAERLIPTAGSQLGLTAVALALATPGEVVLCQSPAYPGATAAFRAAGLGLHPVASDEEGLHPGSLRDAVRWVRAAGGVTRLLYCNPTFSNPAGITTTLRRREELLTVCRELDLLVVEDDPYALLSFTGATVPALASIDPEQVVHLGTFSKIFAPGVRSGWISAPAPAVAPLRRIAEILTLSPSGLTQAALAAFHAAQGWNPLLGAFQASYRQRCELMDTALVDALGAEGEWRWRRPDGGFYLWLTNREGRDTRDFADAAARHGVSFVPGRHFSVDGEHDHGLRLCFSYTATTRIGEGIARLGRALNGTPVTVPSPRAATRPATRPVTRPATQPATQPGTEPQVTA